MQPLYMDYTNFDVSDFICNEQFQNWIIMPDEDSTEFWNQWLQQHPEKKETIEQARKLLLNIKFKEDFPSTEQMESGLEKVLAKIRSLGENEKDLPTRIIGRLVALRRIAAIFIGVAIIGTLLYYYNRRFSETTLSTAYGEIKTITLPDSSKVILNANSSITYAKYWENTETREVTVTGETFFIVKHLNSNEQDVTDAEKFIVHTQDLKVEVLGTEFNVRNRRGTTDVVLKSGKVKVVFNRIDARDLTLTPGEMISYRRETKEVKKTATDPEVQTAWTEKKMILENATVKTITEYLEDNYGYKIIIKDTSIGNKRMEGTLLLDNIQDVIFVLTTSLDITITKQDSTLIFTK